MRKTVEAGALLVAMCAPALRAIAGDGCATVLKSFRAQAAQKAYRIRSTYLNPDTGKVVSWDSTIEAQPPNRFHNVNNACETVVVRGNAAFFRKSKGVWEKDPGAAEIQLDFFDYPRIFELSSRDCKLIATETLKGRRTNVWQYASKNDGSSKGAGVRSISKIWIGATDGLPHQMEIRGELGRRQKYRELKQIEYDPTIAIQAPIP